MNIIILHRGKGAPRKKGDGRGKRGEVGGVFRMSSLFVFWHIKGKWGGEGLD